VVRLGLVIMPKSDSVLLVPLTAPVLKKMHDKYISLTSLSF
jgi:hypothetical protein